LAADNLPDVFAYWLGASDSATFIKTGVIIDVDDFFAVSKKLSRKNFYPWAFSNVAVNGKTYGVPFEKYVGAWLVNKNLFAKYKLAYPKTFDDIMKLAKTFSANGIITLATGSKGGNPGWWFIDQMYTQFKGAEDELHALATTWNHRSDLFKKTLNLFVKMRNAGVFPSDMTTNGDWGPSFALYNEGRAAIIPAWGWQVSAITKEAYEWTQIIDPPVITGEGPTVDLSKIGMITGFMGLEISKKSWKDPNKRQAIIDWVEFFNSDEMFKLRYNAIGVLPAKIIDNFDYYTGALPMVKDMINWNKDKVPNLWHLGVMPSDVAWQQYEASMDSFFSGALSADQFIDKVQAVLDEQKNK
jgi:raffinose/stachyose/melibiose transport system substrate-binding protein